MAKKQNGEATGTEQVTKIEAVRRAMEVLGKQATPNELRAEVKKTFAIDMTVEHAKTCRNLIRRREAREGKHEDETKTEQAPMPQNTNAKATAPAQGEETISKKEAVRRSLEKLGKKAMPKEIRQDIRERFGLEVSSNYVSTTKADLLLKPKAKKPAMKKAEPKEAPQTREPAAVPSATDDGKTGAVEMGDILALRGLLDRVGPDRLKTLIDVMSR